jgi:hypothetical protein
MWDTRLASLARQSVYNVGVAREREHNYARRNVFVRATRVASASMHSQPRIGRSDSVTMYLHASHGSSRRPSIDAAESPPVTIVFCLPTTPAAHAREAHSLVEATGGRTRGAYAPLEREGIVWYDFRAIDRTLGRRTRCIRRPIRRAGRPTARCPIGCRCTAGSTCLSRDLISTGWSGEGGVGGRAQERAVTRESVHCHRSV